jgi:PAS domain S-box-containing protein
VSETRLRRSEAAHPAAGEVEGRARAPDEPGKAVIATDPQGRIVFWDEDAEALYGWTRDEVLGKDVLEVTPSELSRAEAAAIMTALRAGESWSGRFIVRDKQGRRFLAQVTDTPVHDAAGGLIGIVGLSHRIEYLRG